MLKFIKNKNNLILKKNYFLLMDFNCLRILTILKITHGLTYSLLKVLKYSL